jgi:hypothetical protein
MGESHPLCARTRQFGGTKQRDERIGLTENAVTLVGMSFVCFEALAIAVIPQLQAVVKGRSQNIFPVRREGDIAHWRVILVADERF